MASGRTGSSYHIGQLGRRSGLLLQVSFSRSFQEIPFPFPSCTSPAEKAPSRSFPCVAELHAAAPKAPAHCHKHAGQEVRLGCTASRNAPPRNLSLEIASLRHNTAWGCTGSLSLQLVRVIEFSTEVDMVAASSHGSSVHFRICALCTRPPRRTDGCSALQPCGRGSGAHHPSGDWDLLLWSGLGTPLAGTGLSHVCHTRRPLLLRRGRFSRLEEPEELQLTRTWTALFS